MELSPFSHFYDADHGRGKLVFYGFMSKTFADSLVKKSMLFLPVLKVLSQLVFCFKQTFTF